MATLDEALAYVETPGRFVFPSNPVWQACTFLCGEVSPVYTAVKQWRSRWYDVCGLCHRNIAMFGSTHMAEYDNRHLRQHLADLGAEELMAFLALWRSNEDYDWRRGGAHVVMFGVGPRSDDPRWPKYWRNLRRKALARE